MNTNSENIKKGEVTKYFIEKCYGYIEDIEKKSYYFFVDNGNLSYKEIKNSHKFRSGDEVEFKVKLDSKSRQVAYDLTFIKNLKRNEVIEEAKELNLLKGYLKKVEGLFYVKHLNTYLTIPINISNWETDIDLIYEARINQVVTFELVNIDKPFKMSAVLTDRIFKQELTIINEFKNLGTTTYATITGHNEKGYFTTLLDGTVKAFISYQVQDNHFEKITLVKGDLVEVKVNYVSPENEQVKLTVVENKEEIEKSNTKSFVFNEEHFGISTVEKSKITLIKRTHGIVVNALANKLAEKKYLIGNDSNRDLVIHNGSNNIQSIFEIKTSSSTQSIYTAVGQLLLYSISIETITGLFIVIPDLLKPRIKEKLEELNIRPIYYSWHDGEPKFHNLNLMTKYF